MNTHRSILVLILATVMVLPMAETTNVFADSSSTSISLSASQSTSGTVSTAPYQITLSSFNAGTGSNQLLVVGVSANNNNVASVTFGGVSLTQAVSSFHNNDAEFWYLANPSGTGNIVVTMSGSTSAVVGAYLFAGVDLSNPIPTTTTNYTTTPSTPTISITTKYANDWVLDLPSIWGGLTLSSPTCTQAWNVTVPNEISGASSYTSAATPSSVTCSWSASGSSETGDLWDDVAIEVKALHSGSSSGGGSSTSGPPPNCGTQTAIASNFNGNSLSGYAVELHDTSGNTLQTQYTPAATLTLNSGQTYQVEADSYGSCNFAQWSDTGATSDTRTISIQSDTSLTAVFNCG